MASTHRAQLIIKQLIRETTFPSDKVCSGNRHNTNKSRAAHNDKSPHPPYLHTYSCMKSLITNTRRVVNWIPKVLVNGRVGHLLGLPILQFDSWSSHFACWMRNLGVQIINASAAEQILQTVLKWLHVKATTNSIWSLLDKIIFFDVTL